MYKLKNKGLYRDVSFTFSMTTIQKNIDRYLTEEARIATQEAQYEAMIDRARMRELEGE